MVLYPNKLPESERVCSGICTKVDKALYDNNYGKNRIWCAGFLLILAGILGICFS